MSAPVSRCRAGRRCRSDQAETIRDPDTDEPLDRLGAVLTAGHLCDVCTRAVNYALGSLPGDVEELSTLLVPSGEQRLRDPNLPPPTKSKKAPPLPLVEAVLSLQELIDYETTVWAESTADHDDVPWDSFAAEHSGQLDRVGKSCALLKYRLMTLVDLPGQEHRARSRTARRADGHNEDTTTRGRDDYWDTRPGWAGALLLLALHEDAQRFAGRHPGDRLQTPCSKCHRRMLVREHRTNRVYCRFCHDEMTDDDYDAFRNAAFRAYGIPTGEPTPPPTSNWPAWSEGFTRRTEATS